VVGRGEAAEAPPQKVLLAELMRRDNFMFSGATGAVVASGGTLATSAPTYGLIKDVIELVDDACRTRSLIGVHNTVDAGRADWQGRCEAEEGDYRRAEEGEKEGKAQWRQRRGSCFRLPPRRRVASAAVSRRDQVGDAAPCQACAPTRASARSEAASRSRVAS